MADWRNWSGTEQVRGVDVHAPADVEGVVEAVTLAARTGRKVKPIGASHSFSAVAAPVDLQLQMHRLSGVVAHDPATRRVRVRAGTPLHELNPALERLGLALPNLGDIDRQTLAGALSTGTHGTGLRWQGLSAAVVGVEMVLADGSVVRYDDRHQPELVPAAALGLGALGVVTEYELQCVPAFLLRAHEAPSTLDAVLDGLPDTLESVDHFELYWFPHTDRVLTKSNTRVDDVTQRQPLPRWRAALDDQLLANTVFEGVGRFTTRLPRTIPRVNEVSGRALTERTYTDSSYAVFASERRVRFTETEVAVPLEQLPDLLRELHRYCEKRRELVGFPVEVRFAGADDRWLSTSFGRQSGYLAVQQYHRRPHEEYFRSFWAMLGQDARPHWGKMHELTADDLRPRYERFDDFVALRDRLDPERVFGNPYLECVLGT